MTKLAEQLIDKAIEEVSVSTTAHGSTRMRSDKCAEAKAIAEAEDYLAQQRHQFWHVRTSQMAPAQVPARYRYASTWTAPTW